MRVTSLIRFQIVIFFSSLCIIANIVNHLDSIHSSVFFNVWTIVNSTVLLSEYVLILILLIQRKVRTFPQQWFYFNLVLVHSSVFSAILNISKDGTNVWVYAAFPFAVLWLRSAQEIESPDNTCVWAHRSWIAWHICPAIFFLLICLGRSLYLATSFSFDSYIVLNVYFLAIIMTVRGVYADFVENITTQRSLRKEAEVAMAQHSRFTALISHVKLLHLQYCPQIINLSAR